MFEVFPIRIKNALSKIDSTKLTEMRLRVDRQIIVEYNCVKCFLTDNGISLNSANGIMVDKKEIENIFFELCNKSVYAYTDKIIKGFVPYGRGMRVGLCGECVVEDGKITNIKNLSSLNFRIPHAVEGCADQLYNYIKNNIKSVIVISPVGAGKTTMIRDLTRIISKNLLLNVLVVDERNEIFPFVSNGQTVDCISYSPKGFAFENGIRAMSPEVVVTDEIFGEEDFLPLERAVLCGVKVVATMHGNERILEQEQLISRLNKIFELFVFLDQSKGKGTVRKIVDCYGETLFEL